MPTMRVEDGELRIDVESLIGSLSDEDKTKIAKLIGADLHAWRQMAEAVANEDNHYNGDEFWWFDSASMAEVRAKLIPLMPEVARIAAVEWQRQVDDARADEKRMSDWAWAMYHAVNGTAHGPFPEIPKWAPAVREEMRQRDAAPAMREAIRLLVEEIDDPCRRQGPGIVLSEPCIAAVRAALRAADGDAPAPTYAHEE